MTKEQAVVYLRFSGFSDEQIKAIEGAFSCDKCVYSTSEGCQYDDITETIPPFDDCIRRQAVLDTLERMDKALDEDRTVESYKDLLRECYKFLPSVSSSEKPDRWIPVSERLPKKFSYVNCTCHSLIDDREDWVVETCYIPLPPNSPYSDWGNIPMLNNGNCEVVAWMYRDIPEPYMAEGSDKE